jgi:hypothetical protein
MKRAKHAQREESHTPLSPILPPKGSVLHFDQTGLLRGEKVHIDRGVLRWGEANEDALVVYRVAGWTRISQTVSMMATRKEPTAKQKKNNKRGAHAAVHETDLFCSEDFCSEDFYSEDKPDHRKSRGGGPH